ncbi:MAG: D-alanyl-D-alanine carboxypeptidase [Microbacteriaceae bacterium]|nr:D-alanyl-D-alanine carboxypeptidase [Microbacteriaceae bacterium]
MPLTRRQVYRRRRLLVFGAVALVVATGLYLPFTLLAPVQAADAAVHEFSAPAATSAAVTWPGYGASALGAVGYTGVLAASGSTDALPIASISKVVTTLVVLDAKPLAVGDNGPDVTFTAADAALYGKYVALKGKVAGMPVGSHLSQLDFMRVVLVVSANNYADALSTWAFGSSAAYLAATGAWLAKHGLDHTTVLEPTGIDPGNTSTASDLVALGKLALANPVVASIVRTPSVSYPGIGTYTNTNELLGVDGIDGIKTGTLDSAGAMLLFAADFTVGTDTITLVGAVLGGKDHDSLNVAVRSLLQSAETGFHQVTLTTKGQPFATYTTPWGASAAAVAETANTAIAWGATPVTAVVDSVQVHLAKRGSAAGTVVFTVGERSIRVPLELDSTISDPGPWWRLGHPLEALDIAA